MRVNVDARTLRRMKGDLSEKRRTFARHMAQTCQAEIQMNFNPQSPAPEGEAPGVVTGNLKSSVLFQPVPGMDAFKVVIQANYGIHLEFGTEHMAARPFVRPAIDRTIASVPDRVKVKVVEP